MGRMKRHDGMQWVDVAPSAQEFDALKNSKGQSNGLATLDANGQVPSSQLDNVSSYTHPTSAGYKHIPSGGSSGQFLSWGGTSGVAKWESILTEQQVFLAPSTNNYELHTYGIGGWGANLTTGSDYYQIQSQGGEAILSTKYPINLTGWNLLTVTWEGDAYGSTQFVISASASSTGSYTSSTKYFNKGSGDFAKTTDSLTVSDLNGDYYLKIHVKSSSTTNFTDINAYRMILSK